MKRKSSFSISNSACVEVEFLQGGMVRVTDSKDPANTSGLLYTPEEWQAFTSGVKAGEFETPLT